MKRPKKGRGLFYTRDSGGKHEMTPSEYVAWGQQEAKKLGLNFDGAPDAQLAVFYEPDFAHAAAADE